MAIANDAWKLVNELEKSGFQWELDGRDGQDVKFTIFDGVFGVELCSAKRQTAEEAIKEVYDSYINHREGFSDDD